MREQNEASELLEKVMKLEQDLQNKEKESKLF